MNRVIACLVCLFVQACTSEPPVCYEQNDPARPSSPHLVRDNSGMCVRSDSLEGDAGFDAGIDSGAIDTRLAELDVAAPAILAEPFSSEVASFNVAAPFMSDKVVITATVQDSRATLEIGGMSAQSGQPLSVNVPTGQSTVTVRVSASSQEPTVYTLAIERASELELAHYLKASNTDEEDRFGQAVAIDDDTLVVGAPSENSNATLINGDQSDNQAGSSGAVYVFRRAEGTWAQEAYIKASNTDTGDNFGEAVAIEGDILVVGAPGEDGGAREVDGNAFNNARTDSGAAYVYRRSGTTWAFDGYLKASNADEGDAFGASVALRAGAIVVGAPNEASRARGVGADQENNDGTGAGAAYLFRSRDTGWQQEVYFKAENAEAGDRFGETVALEEGVVVVGAPAEASDGSSPNNNDASFSGAAYVFRFSGGSWSQEAYLKASNAHGFDGFAESISMFGNTLVIGASSEDSGSTNVDGDRLNDDEPGAGAAYVYVYESGDWLDAAYLKATNTGSGDSFGKSVSISGGFIAVGAINERGTSTEVNGPDNDDETSTGAAYLYHFEEGSWKTHAYVKPPVFRNDGYFGTSVAVGGGTLAVGFIRESGSAKGVDGPLSPATTDSSGAVFTFE